MKAYIANSGSGFRIEAHIGAEQALTDAKVHILGRSGTSGGAMVAGLAAMGMPSQTMWNLARSTNFTKFFGLNLTALPEFSYCTGNYLYKWLLKNTKGQAFEDTIYPLWVIASNVSKQCREVFSPRTNPKMLLAEAIRASVSVPFAYEPYVYQNSVYGDGGMCNNEPGAVLPIEHGVPRIILNVTSKNNPYENEDLINSPLIRSEALINLMMTELNRLAISLAIAQAPKQTFVVRIETPSNITMLDTNLSKEQQVALYTAGQEATAALLKKIAHQFPN